jgi:hypothetical protein
MAGMICHKVYEFVMSILIIYNMPFDSVRISS